MKLYTEEQVRSAFRIGLRENYIDEQDAENFANKGIKYLKPIELPSDEEIIYRCFQEDSYELATDGDSALKTYTDGYRAALEQILNQNK